MDVSPIRAGGSLLSQQSSEISQADAAERRSLTRATKAVNESGALGKDQLVFMVDAKTHRPIIRVQDRETNEVIMQIPAEVVLQIAQNLKVGR